MGTVRTALRETVMDVTHYDRDYGDSLTKNVRVEFGPDLAELVTQDGPPSPVARAAFLEAGREAKSERVRFLGLLRRERSSLRRVRNQLNGVESRLVGLQSGPESPDQGEAADDYTPELQALLDMCESLADRRQETIHDRAVGSLSGVECDSLVAHLYGELESTCPVLADVADCTGSVHYALDRD